MLRPDQREPYRADVVPFVTIVIPTYNAAKTIRLCLEAIQELDYPTDRYDVIVVDNNSTDGTPEIVAQYPVRLLFERQIQGPHAATNVGARQARGDVMAFTDADCICDPGWLRALVAPFADADVVAVGGRIEAYRPRSRVERFLAEDIKPFVNCLRLSEAFPASVLTGNAAYRADAVRAVGMFNANLYTGADVDLAWRVQWHTGKRVAYASEAVVYHQFSPSTRRLFRHFRIYGYSEVVLGTMYKDIPGYPRSPGKQLRVMLHQGRAILTYLASVAYRSVTGPLRGNSTDYVSLPALWLVAETASICGKLEAMWLTRFYRRCFWINGPKRI